MKRKLKILACSDLHGLNPEQLLKKNHKFHFDVLVIAGDIVEGDEVLGRARFEKHVMPFLGSLGNKGVQCIVVPGNHDWGLWGYRNKFPELPNVHILVDREVEVCGLRFYGTPWCPFINGAWAWERHDFDLVRMFNNIPNGIDILVSHSPPNGSGRGYFDVSTQYDARYWEHFGSKALLNRINLVRPKITICGHIHSGDHTPVDIGSTTVVNVSLLDEHYTLSYSPTMIEVDANKKMVVKFQKG